VRAIQLYAPQIDKAAYAQAIARANPWLVAVASRDNQDRLYRVMGLVWAGNKAEAEKALSIFTAAMARSTSKLIPASKWIHSGVVAKEANYAPTGRSRSAIQVDGKRRSLKLTHNPN
jgi:hypothetical protein